MISHVATDSSSNVRFLLIQRPSPRRLRGRGVFRQRGKAPRGYAPSLLRSTFKLLLRSRRGYSRLDYLQYLFSSSWRRSSAVASRVHDHDQALRSPSSELPTESPASPCRLAGVGVRVPPRLLLLLLFLPFPFTAFLRFRACLWACVIFGFV